MMPHHRAMLLSMQHQTPARAGRGRTANGGAAPEIAAISAPHSPGTRSPPASSESCAHRPRPPACPQPPSVGARHRRGLRPAASSLPSLPIRREKARRCLLHRNREWSPSLKPLQHANVNFAQPARYSCLHRATGVNNTDTTPSPPSTNPTRLTA
ncbi:hypothetical protein BU26DRAFT_246352 [Trematosphaeria pertusa]|uniref:Uncharacterized protein n=1 Tax=Trematosphaeria pertusa TaxID=390896 RepID=A0A6A6INA2_9PLEO|nr:uncharacterized protein BU26DRAFT_246352 [Trematosphaeria pertusa]KAF2251866.1 hypothetical protein BU26DRAFT_246352 [Trematosphaeria pertusa]